MQNTVHSTPYPDARLPAVTEMSVVKINPKLHPRIVPAMHGQLSFVSLVQTE